MRRVDPASVQRLRDEAIAQRRLIRTQLLLIINQRQQRQVDIEIRATRTALLKDAHRRCGNDIDVLFDNDFLAVADETTVGKAILRAALLTCGTDACYLQLLDPADGTLHIRAQQGFTPAFLAAFATVPIGYPTACSTAMATGEPVLINDVTRSPIFRGQPTLDIMLEGGTRAMASYPLRAGNGDVFGVLSFHYHRPHLGSGNLAVVARGAAMALNPDANARS